MSKSLLIGLCALALGATFAPASAMAQTAHDGRIVYVAFDEANGESDLFTVSPDASGVRRITFDGFDEGRPEWSPDGERIAYDASGFDSGSCCSRNIFVINGDGSGRQQLTHNPDVSEGQNFGASWAPGSSWLVFVSDRGAEGGFAGDREVYRMNADGSRETQLTDTDARTSDEAPAVSPDGTQIAFASDRANPASDSIFDIYTMDADGTDVSRLTFDGALASPLTSRSTDPAWSPDGSRIAFESTRSGNHEIWVMDADGTDAFNVSANPAADTDPSWSPDGTQITFVSTRSGQEDVWAAPAAAAATTERRTMLRAAGETDGAVNLTPTDGHATRSPDWGGQGAGSPPECTIRGTSGPDEILGTKHADVICGGAGGDIIRSAGRSDVIRGGSGPDRLLGGAGDDWVIGGSERDRLYGAFGFDVLHSRDGVAGNDVVDGGPDADRAITDGHEASVTAVP